jgi:hypothetical protein
MNEQKVEIKIKGLYVNYSGVYGIKDNVSEQWLYVGAGKEMNNRFSTHTSTLLSGKHRNKRLQEHFNNVNGDITIVVLEYGDNLAELEEKWTEELKPLYSKLTRAGVGFYQSKNPESTKKRRVANLGSRNPRAKLSDDQVHEILWLKEYSNFTIIDIAKRYKVSQSLIYSIGKSKWLHITDKVKPDWFDIQYNN